VKLAHVGLACHTQEEIAAAVDVTKETVSSKIELCQDLETFPKSDKLLATFQDADFSPPLYNVWRYGECSALPEQHLAEQAHQQRGSIFWTHVSYYSSRATPGRTRHPDLLCGWMQGVRFTLWYSLPTVRLFLPVVSPTPHSCAIFSAVFGW